MEKNIESQKQGKIITVEDGFETLSQKGWNRSNSQKEIKNQSPDPSTLGMAARFAKNTQILLMSEKYRSRMAMSESPAEESKKIIAELEIIAAKESVRHTDIRKILSDTEALSPLAARELLKVLKDPEFSTNPIRALTSLISRVEDDNNGVIYQIYKRLDPSNKELFLATLDTNASLVVAEKLTYSKDFKEQQKGVKIIEGILKAHPNHPAATNALSHAYWFGLGIAEDGKKSVDLLLIALKEFPGDPILLSSLAQKYLNGVKSRDGIVIIEKDLAKAQMYLSQALENNPKYSWALFLNGHCLKELGNAQEAFDSFVRMTKAGPNDSRGFFHIGKMYQEGFVDGMGARQQNISLAIKYFKYAADLGNKEAKIELNNINREKNNTVKKAA